MAGLKVNFSEQEAQSEGRLFTPVPTGQYYARVTEIELKECGPESKNPGKPFWAVTFTIQDGEYEDRKLWTNAMLFEGALYTTAQLLKATGFEKSLETGTIPDGERLIGKEVTLLVQKQRDAYREKQNADGEPVFKNEVKGIKKYEGGGSKGKTSGSGSLLP